MSNFVPSSCMVLKMYVYIVFFCIFHGMCIDFVVVFGFLEGGVCLRFSFVLQQFGNAGMEQFPTYWRGSWKFPALREVFWAHLMTVIKRKGGCSI